MTDQCLPSPDTSDSLPDTLTFTPDQHAVLQRELRELAQGHALLLSILNKGPELPRELTKSVLYLAESRNVAVAKITGIPLDSVAEQERRYARIRGLNQTVRQLERQLGQSGTGQQTQASLKVLAEKLRQWWSRDGFGHVSSLQFTEYGSLDAVLSCHLFGSHRGSTHTTTPVSGALRHDAWLAALAQRGFVTASRPHEQDPVIVDCDQTRGVLRSLITGQFDSARIAETTNHWCSKSGQFELRSVRVVISDLQDVQRLPDMPEAST